MQSLTDLNNRAAQTINFTENRGTNVIFDRAAGKQYNFTETTLTFDVLVGANIVEIINPSIANVRYQINLGTTQASITTGTLPVGVTVNQVGTIFTFYGIDSLSDWEAVKQPSIVVDPAFAGTMSYSAAVVYNTDTQANVQFEWNVGVYVPDAELTAITSLNCDPTFLYGGVADITSFFGLAVEGVKVLGSVFNMVTNAKRFARIGVTMAISSTLTAKPKDWLFTDTVLNIDMPDPQRDNHKFSVGAWDGANIIIGAVKRHSTKSAFAVNKNSGNTEFSFNRQVTGGGTSVTTSECTIEGHNDEYVVIVEPSGTDNADDTLVLWKKQATGDLYTVIDTITFADPTGGSGGQGVSITNRFGATTVSPDGNYLIIVDGIFESDFLSGGSKGKVRVYSIDDTTGLTLEYTHTGTDRQNLGSSIAINNDYYVIAERKDQGPSSRIFVYDTATGTLQQTLNTGSSAEFVNNMTLVNNILYIHYDDNTLEVYDIDTSTTTSTVTLETPTTYIYAPGTIRIYDATFIHIGGHLYNRSTGKIQSSPGPGIFLDTNTLATYDNDYDDTYTDQGRIIIGTET